VLVGEYPGRRNVALQVDERVSCPQLAAMLESADSGAPADQTVVEGL
jgi:hypothetical protein